MSKSDAVLLAMLLIVAASGIVILAMVAISVLMVSKPITWIVLGLFVLLTIMIAIGIYQYDKHYLN